MKETFLLFVALATMLSGLFAIPAKKGFWSVNQSDGTTLLIQLEGDEFRHRRTTQDHYSITETDKGYCYVTTDSNGQLIASDVLAHNPEMRSASESLFLEGIPKGVIAPASKRSTVKRKLNKGLLQPSSAKSFPTKGTVKSLVLLIEFSDKAFAKSTAHDDFTQMLNAESYTARGHKGSARQYFKENSMGLFTPELDVYGPIKVSKPVTYYGKNSNGNDAYVDEMILEACKLANSQINFKDYDLDGDGEVENIYIYYAGYGEASGGPSYTIWPHAFFLDVTKSKAQRTFDGVALNSYGCSNELQGGSGTVLENVGTFCHEFGHNLGLPDFYDTDYEANGQGVDPGEFEVMSYGNSGNNGACPSGYSAMDRWMLGWATPTYLETPISCTLLPFETKNQFYLIPTSDRGEYFILENRQAKSGSWDEYIPGSGMLIYHVDQRANVKLSLTFNTDGSGDKKQNLLITDLWGNYNALNALSTHQCYEIERASGSGSEQTAGSPFPGTGNKRSFTDTTKPSMKTWGGVALNKPITNIKSTNGVITFDFMGGDESGVEQLGAINYNSYVDNGVLHLSDLPTSATIRIYNTMGQLQFSGANDSHYQINSLSKGVYLIQFNDQSQSQSFKVKI